MLNPVTLSVKTNEFLIAPPESRQQKTWNLRSFWTKTVLTLEKSKACPKVNMTAGYTVGAS